MDKVRILRLVLVRGKSIDYARTQRERQVPCRAWRCHPAFVMPSQIMYDWPSDSSACKGPSFGISPPGCLFLCGNLGERGHFSRATESGFAQEATMSTGRTNRQSTLACREDQDPPVKEYSRRLSSAAADGSWPMGIGAFSPRPRHASGISTLLSWRVRSSSSFGPTARSRRATLQDSPNYAE